MDRTAFVQSALHAAKTAYLSKPVFSPVIAAAQAALESNFGTSRLAREANNLAGVKAGSSWKGPVLELPTREQRPDGSWYTTVARWRKYDSWVDAFLDYANLIERVYPFAVRFKGKPREFLAALVANEYPKYATDENYIEKVWAVVEQYNLLGFADTCTTRTSKRLKLHQDHQFIQAWEIPPGKRVVIAFEPDGNVNVDIRSE